MRYFHTHVGLTRRGPVTYIYVNEISDHFVYAPSQWETTLHCNVVSHWLGANTIGFSVWQATRHYQTNDDYRKKSMEIWIKKQHYSDVIMSAMASQITYISISIVCSTACLGVDQRKHQRSASLAFVRGIHRYPLNSLHKGQVTRKMFPFDDVIMKKNAFESVVCKMSNILFGSQCVRM